MRGLRRIVVVSFLAIVTIQALGQSRGLTVVVDKLSPGTPVGMQYLVMVAINKYKEWPSLKQPVTDARAIEKILTSRYYIDNVIELFDQNATKASIIKLFVDLQKKLQVNDSLLFYYAGHGHLDATSNSGFWVPTDAGLDPYAQVNWIPNSQIRGFIENIKAKHVCLISDSCFSGDILDVTRAKPPTVNELYFKNAYDRRSRQVLTSGSSEAVPDKSEFSAMLIRTLEENSKPYLDPLMMYDDIRLGITATTPLLGNLKDTGAQDGASFLLFLKTPDAAGGTQKTTAITTTPATVPAAGSTAAQAAAATQPQQTGADTFVRIAGASFTMGCSEGHADEQPPHLVSLGSFSIARHDVTFAEYDAFCDATGRARPSDEGWGRAQRPVINVSWYDAVRYCNWRSEKEGLTPAYSGREGNMTCDFAASGYRLPTEAEWEYAARGGPLSRDCTYAGSNDSAEVAWSGDPAGGRTQPVGTRKPNEIGLYDMSGNVWQWCWDWFSGDYYGRSEKRDPIGPGSGNRKVRRGGSWRFLEGTLRVTDRYGASPNEGSSEIGFRLARTIK
jgi:formylglycine-generating enzyme required for sulfatase activity